MDFVASINIRTYVEFAILGTRGTRDDFKDGEPEVRDIEVEQIISEPKIRKLGKRLSRNRQGWQRRGEAGDQRLLRPGE